VAIRSKRLKAISMEEGLPEGLSYCRRCMKIKRTTDFHKAVDHELDRNGLFSVCKSCVDEIYSLIYVSENGSVNKTILRLCRMLNVVYNEDAISAALTHVASKDSDPMKLFGLYRAKVLVMLRTKVDDTTLDLTYKDNPIVNLNTETPSEDDVEYDVIEYWGTGYTKEDYAWLERKLTEWKKTHKSDTMGEETLLREIVFKQFEIEKARKEQKSTASLVKELQDIMKTAAVDPSKSNVAGSGKSFDTFSAFIKMIEENEPAEVYGAERDAFKDFQNIDQYFKKYIQRPLKNFVTNSRDFNVSSEDDFDEEDSGDYMETVVKESDDGKLEE
jgi:hypothetical protein